MEKILAKTQRIYITEFTMDMAYDVHKNSLDDDNRRFVPDEVFETEEDARETIEFLMSCYDGDEGPYVYPIITFDNENIGYVEAAQIDEGWEIGYHIALEYTKKGYATEAVKSFVPFILKKLKCESIYGVVLAENEASCKVLTKAGFEKIFDGEDCYQGEKRHVIKYRINAKKDYDCGFEVEDKWFRYRAAAIIIEDGCVLLATNDVSGYCYSVGGGVHMGETAKDAVEREVYEETGIRYEADRLAFIHENFFDGDGKIEGKKCHEIAFYYLMKPKGSKELNSYSICSEGREYMKWIPLNDIDNYKLFPTFFKEKLKNLSDGIEHIVADEIGEKTGCK